MGPRQKLFILFLMHHVVFRVLFFALLLVIVYLIHTGGLGRRPRRQGIRYSILRRIPYQVKYVDKLLNTSDTIVKNSFRMNRDCFMKLCYLLHSYGGLQDTKYVGISSQVSMFLDTLSHHTKNRIIGRDFVRSGETVSRLFDRVLLASLKCYTILLSTPEPIGPGDIDPTWKPFQGCLGALDGSFFQVCVPVGDKGRYRTRKRVLATNLLVVCDRNGLFVFLLAGWEGSAADSRVLRDGINREDGLKIPTGCYSLGDGGYTNGEGFLVPYRGVRYHLRDWETSHRTPQNYKEYFNLKHARARNVIECAFGALKGRWGILRKHSWFSVKRHNHMIMACALLHNFIRTNMPNAVLEEDYPRSPSNTEPEPDYIDVVAPAQAWHNFRENMAKQMYNEWQAGRRRWSAFIDGSIPCVVQQTL